jgi:hypothetical protein
MAALAQGGNYRIEIVSGIAVCTVWKRPDLSRDEGAALAEEKVEHHQRLASGSKLVARAMILDLREAPTQWGPSTNESLASILRFWQNEGRRAAVVTADDFVQRLLVRQLAQNVGLLVRPFERLDEADAWVREQKGLAP